MEVKGRVLRIEEVNKISDTFKKREVVIQTGEDKYIQTISLQLSQDKVDLINGFSIGDELDFHLNLRGREWTSPKDNSVRVFNTLEVWKIDGESKSQTEPTAPAMNETFEDNKSDLPF